MTELIRLQPPFVEIVDQNRRPTKQFYDVLAAVQGLSSLTGDIDAINTHLDTIDGEIAAIEAVLGAGVPPNPDQTITTNAGTVTASDRYIVVNYSGDCTLTLPSISLRAGVALYISDLSTGIGGSGHTITLTPNGADRIFRLSSWGLFSSGDDYLSSIQLRPAATLANWY